MKKFTIKEDILELFPEVKLGVIVCKGINNRVRDEKQFQSLIDQSAEKAVTYLENDEFSKNPVIRVWREAFLRFKTKKGARSSIEALLKRVQKGNTVGTINPLVDIYNSISLKYALPCGGEDIDAFASDVSLTLAEGGEDFITYGSDTSAPALQGEVIYKDDAGVICRCWNWRESVRTMLTEETTNAFMCIELIDPSRTEEFEMALKELGNLIETHLGGTNKISILDVNNTEIELTD